MTIANTDNIFERVQRMTVISYVVVGYYLQEIKKNKQQNQENKIKENNKYKSYVFFHLKKTKPK